MTHKGKAMKGRSRVYQTDEQWAKMMSKELMKFRCNLCHDTGIIQGLDHGYKCVCGRPPKKGKK